MGLDGIELVMAVEEAFDIHIEDAEAEKLLTPRLLMDYVQSKVTTATTTVCLTQRAFNLLRKSLLRHGGWKRSEITPATSLPALLPRNQRLEIIQNVIAELGIKQSPVLVRPRWVNIVLVVGSLLAGLAVNYATGQGWHSVGIWIFIGVFIAAVGIGLRLTKPQCKEFPAHLQTIGDLAQWVMVNKSDLANPTTPGWTKEQIDVRVRQIIVEQLGVKPDFSENANFVKDLGMG